MGTVQFISVTLHKQKLLVNMALWTERGLERQTVAQQRPAHSREEESECAWLKRGGWILNFSDTERSLLASLYHGHTVITVLRCPLVLFGSSWSSSPPFTTPTPLYPRSRPGW